MERYEIDLNTVDGNGETVLVKAIKLASLPWSAWSHNFTSRRGDWKEVFEVLTDCTGGGDNRTREVRDSLMRLDEKGFLPIHWARARGLRKEFGLDLLEEIYARLNSDSLVPMVDSFRV